MPDRTTTSEEQLDQWLDALNEPGGATPPAPAAIADLAEVALAYRRALAPSGSAAIPERNGRMHHAQTLATPNGARWRALARPERRRIDWGSWLATAAMIALLVGLIGGAAMRTWGLPGGDDPSHLAGIAASPAATQVLPAQDFATPTVTPENAALSCASPGYVPVVRGDVDAAALAEIGAPDAIVRGDTTTITAAIGAEIEFGPDEQWTVFPSSDVILSGEGDGSELPTVTSLATGQSWTFPSSTTDRVGSLSGSYLMVGPWLFGPTDVTATDWRVINTDTGEERLTSDIFGAPFVVPARMHVAGPWEAESDGPVLVGFALPGSRSAVLVLPSTDPADAWAPGDEHAEAGFTGMITADGSRIAYLHLDESGEATVRVLDGFTGEQLDEYLAPDADGDILQPVGLTADDGKMIVRDNQTVWNVDLATGEIATVFDPGRDIHEFAFDPTTGTAIASSSDDAFTWLDPATGKTKSLDIPLPMRFPQPQFGWALIQTRDDIAVDYALLDMTTGELVAGPIGADRDENGTNAWITGGDETGVYVIQAESGRMLVLDGPGGQAFELATPETGRTGWNGVSIGVSPNGGCLVYTEVGEGDEPGTSWIAPLEPDANWTELPFELGPWIEMPPAPAAPAATPATLT